MSWLLPELEREGAVDALEAPHRLAHSDAPVTEEALEQLIDRLHPLRRG